VSPRFARAVTGATLLAALLSTSLYTGGYTFAGQRLLLLLTALLILELVWFVPTQLLGALRLPLVGVLALLTVWTGASAAWTIGAPGDAIRWAVVTLDYGALALSGAVIARWQGPQLIAAPVAIVATVEGVIGAWAEALRHIPEAVLLSDSWRPAGNFQYAPALTLLEVCGLPWLLIQACGSGALRCRAGAFALAIIGLTLGTEDSRLPLALAIAVVIVLGLKADRVSLPGRELSAAAILLALCAVIADLTLGRQDLGDHPGSSLDVVLTFAGCLLIAALWPWLRRLVRPLPSARLWFAAAGLVVLAVGIWVLVGYTGTLTSSGGGLDHARFSYWSAAFNSWKLRPVLGSGAETFFASANHFELSDDLTLYAHDLPLELAAELGIPGFLLALGLYLTVGRDVWRWLRTSVADLPPDAWLLAPAAAAFLIQSLFDWPWHFAALGAVWALAAGGLGALTRRPRRPRQPGAGSAGPAR
jgi:hypothetical protein